MMWKGGCKLLDGVEDIGYLSVNLFNCRLAIYTHEY